MSEDVIGKLTRFSPTATGLDRDEFLFRAGRASAPSGRWWKVAAGVLALTQVGMAVAWVMWPQPAPVVVVPPAVQPAEVEPETEPSEPLPRNSYFILSRTDPDESYHPTDTGPSGPSKPAHPLTAGWHGGPID